MGRAFEYRKARKMKRNGEHGKNLHQAGKRNRQSVAEGGWSRPRYQSSPEGIDPDFHKKRRTCRKENVERAIKRATDRDASDYKEVRYEGYGPHGVAVLVETATDNTTRTVANVRVPTSISTAVA